MRLVLLALLSVVLNLLGNVLASWADAQWGLTQPSRIVVSVASFVLALVALIVLEVGAPVPGSIAFHRFAYLFDLSRSRSLRIWATGFARLHIGKGPRYVASAEVWTEGERRDLIALLSKELTRRKQEGKRILVLGEPGCGKSTALERLALELAMHSVRRAGLRGPLPVLFRATDFQAGQDLRKVLESAILLWAKPTTGRILTTPHFLGRLLGSPRLVLLCDGLDELSGERRDQLLAQLDAVSRVRGLAQVSVVTTCRTRQDPDQALGLYESYSILELSDEAVLSFVEIYASAAEPTEAVFDRLLHGDFLDTGGLGRNPFWLKRLLEASTLAQTRSGILFDTSRKALSAELQKPRSSKRSWRRPAELSEEQIVEECQRALGRLAAGLAGGRTLARDRARSLLAAFLGERARTLGLQHELFPDQVLELARDAGLFHGQPDPVSFGHRIVQEFYVALDILHGGPLPDEALRRLVGEPGQWTTLALYAGLLPVGAREDLVRSVLTTAAPSALACAIAVFIENRSVGPSPLAEELQEALGEALSWEEEPDLQLQTSLRELLAIGHDRGAEFMGRLFSDPFPEVRVRLCRLLALSEAPAALRLLATLGLDDRDEEVGEAAVAALVACGKRAVWPLLRQLADPEPGPAGQRLRDRAARALGELRAPEAVRWLLRCPGDDREMSEHLASCAHGRSGRLLVGLAFGDSRERIRAALALSATRQEKALRLLTGAVLDEDVKVRNAVLEILREWPAAPAAKDKGDPPEQRPAIQALLAAIRSEEKGPALWALEEIEVWGDSAAINAAHEEANGRTSDLFSETEVRLAQWRGEQRRFDLFPPRFGSLADLIGSDKPLDRPPNPWKRRSIEALIRLKRAPTTPEDDRASAEGELVRRARESDPEELLALLDAESPAVRRFAADALHRHRDEVRSELLHLLADGESHDRQLAALTALEGDESPETVAALLPLLSSPDLGAAALAALAPDPEVAERVAETILELSRSREGGERRLAVELAALAAERLEGSKGPEIGAFLLRAAGDPETQAPARKALTEAPLAWIHGHIADALFTSSGPLLPEVILLAARCQEAGALHRLAQETTGISRAEAAAALGRLGNPRALPVLRDLLLQESLHRGLETAARESLALLSTEIRPELIVLLNSRRSSPALLIGAAEALSAPGDLPLAAAPRLLDMLADDSPRIAEAGAVAISQAVDDVLPLLSARSAPGRPAAAQSYFELLLSLLEGEPTPRQQRIFAPVKNVEPLVRASLDEHLLEFFQRMGLAGAVLLAGGFLGILVPDPVLRSLSTFIYGIAPHELAVLLPPSPQREEILAVLLALWLGAPAFVYQIWRYVRPGLYSNEKRLARPVVATVAGVFLAMPLFVLGGARLLQTLDRRFAALDFTVAAFVTAANRCAVVLALALVLGLGLRPFWRLLAERAREQYVLSLTERNPIHRRQTLSARVGLALLLSVAVATTAILCLPLFVTAALGAGFFWSLCMAAVALWSLLRGVRARKEPIRSRSGAFSQGYIGAIVLPHDWTGLWLLLFLFFRSSGKAGDWLSSLLGIGGPAAGAISGDASWSAFTFAAWMACLAVGAAFWIFNLFKPGRPPWRESLAVLAALCLLASPALLARLWWEALGAVSPHLDSATRSGWSVRLAILSAIVSITAGLLLSVRPILGRLEPVATLGLLLAAAVTGCFPTIVLAGMIGFPGFLFVIAIPGLSVLGLAFGVGGIKRTLFKFRKAGQQLEAALQPRTFRE
jgi:HEAT repeat protein/energy-coupling factor transporter ATP-binding protein EcfA2